MTKRRGLSPPKHLISALPHAQSLPRSACEQFREEPAIDNLDWPFTPIPRSSERFEHQYRCGPPPSFQRASPCPGIDRLSSGIQLLTPGERTSPLTIRNGCGLSVSLRLRTYVLNLANNRNSTDQFSNRTVQHRSAVKPHLPLHAVPVCNRLISGSF